MKLQKPLFFILILFVLLLVFLLNITFAGSIPASIMLIIRIAFIMVFLSGWIVFRRTGNKNFGDLFFILMAVNLAFLVVSFFTTDLWKLDIETPRGIALAKMSDSIIIFSVVLMPLFLSGFKLKDIYISRGKLLPGLIIGMLSFLLMGFLAIKNPEQPIGIEFIKTNLVWILIFVLFNAFMEELIFRGIFLKPLNQFFKPAWAVVLTAIVFGAAHLQVTYTPDVLIFAIITLVLGLIWGFLIQYTRSLLASVLFHAGADLVIILPIYVTYGVGV
ncbi:MAG TPA: hypothetical protein DEQ09_04095 [Bacteroidales bacterium]|nr:hypothetical protein [Bacteroidales bacterium]